MVNQNPALPIMVFKLHVASSWRYRSGIIPQLQNSFHTDPLLHLPCALPGIHQTMFSLVPGSRKQLLPHCRSHIPKCHGYYIHRCTICHLRCYVKLTAIVNCPLPHPRVKNSLDSTVVHIHLRGMAYRYILLLHPKIVG